MSDYVRELELKLQARREAARKGNQVKVLKDSAPLLFEIIDGEISLEINRGYSDTPLSYEGYLESHGAVRGIKRIRNLLDSKEVEAVQASQEVQALENNLKQIKDDKKQQ